MVEVAKKLCLANYLYLLISGITSAINVANRLARPGLLHSLIGLLIIIISILVI